MFQGFWSDERSGSVRVYDAPNTPDEPKIEQREGETILTQPYNYNHLV